MSNLDCLVIAPHMDDELHCAGLIQRESVDGRSVGVLALSDCETPGLSREWRQSCSLLGVEFLRPSPVVRFLHREFPAQRQMVLEALLRAQRDHSPSLVIVPPSNDLHQDHRVVSDEALRAFRHIPLLLGWDHPNNERGRNRTTLFIKLSQQHVDRKVDAWRCYETQKHRTWFSEDLIRSMAVVRGSQCRSKTGLAEGYEVLSGVW